ncbi:hypothetical protein CGRA01v4_13965 [Colletotrichum graminicola]|nr:hypothetical protein CGRA01v4_13965 [Colletotrichum graminicola]
MRTSRLPLSPASPWRCRLARRSARRSSHPPPNSNGTASPIPTSLRLQIGPQTKIVPSRALGTTSVILTSLSTSLGSPITARSGTTMTGPSTITRATRLLATLKCAPL